MINTWDAAFSFKVGQVASLALWQQGILQTLSTFQRQRSCLPQPIGWAQVQGSCSLSFKSSWTGMRPQRPSHYPAALQIWAITHATAGCKLIWIRSLILQFQSSHNLQVSETPGAGIWLGSEQAVRSTWREPPGHKGNAKGHLVLQPHRGMVCCHQSWWCLVLSNASALPSEIQLTFHTITSLGTHSGGNFGYGQSLLLPVYINRKGHWPDIIQDKGKRWGKKKKKWNSSLCG